MDATNENKKRYLTLKDLEIYQISRNLSKLAWIVYDKLNWREKKIIGDQFITAIDSIGANIAEGYRRFHYLDKIRFLYTSRASLSEGIHHWAELLLERNILDKEQFETLSQQGVQLDIKLANFINTIYQQKRSN